MNGNLDSMIRALAQLQAELRDLEEQLNTSRRAWEEANRSIISRRDRVEQAVEELDHSIRLLARKEFLESGDKHPHRSVAVYKQKKLHYDENVAREWALEMGRDDLLTVRRSEFAKAAKEGVVPDDVARFEDEVIVRIDRLGEYTIADDDTQPLETGAEEQVAITPTAYDEGKSLSVNAGALVLLNKAAARLVNAAMEAIQLVIANHPNVMIAEPMPLSPTCLVFSAMKGEQPLQGQEDFAHELQTCKSDAELVLAIARRIEHQMGLSPIIRTADRAAAYHAD